MKLRELFLKKTKPVRTKKTKNKLIIDNSNTFQKGLDVRQLGPRTSRLTEDFEEDLIRTATINNEIRASADHIRRMSRTISINSPYGKKAVSHQIANVIGSGIDPQPRLLDVDGRPKKELNQQISDAFTDWSSKPRRFSKNRRMNWRRFEQMIERARFIDGEVFIRLHRDNELKISIIEAARCKFGDRETTDDGYILDGIEYDNDDAPIRYWFTEVDKITQTEKGGRGIGIPADEIIHYYYEYFPDQRRGVPEAVANISTLNQLDAFTNATLVQKRAAASSMGFVTQDKDGQGDVDLGLDADNDIDEQDTAPDIIQEFESGTIHKLPPGYDIKQFASTQGGDDFTSFTDRLEDQLAMGYGFYKQGWKGDTSNINYSAARFGDQVQRLSFKTIQQNLKEQVFEIIFECWLEYAVLNDYIPIKMTAIPKVLRQTVWTYPKWESIDPIKDAQKDALDVDNGFVSASDVIINRGGDPELVFAQVDQEKDRYIPKKQNQIAVAKAPAEVQSGAQVEVAEINNQDSENQ